MTDKVQPGRHLAAVLACLPYAFFLLVSPSLAQEAAPRSAVRLFDYDERQPLDIREAGRFDRPGCTVVDLTYASPKGGRVPAFLVVPKGKGPFAAILFGHWGGGNRTEFLPEAELYARVGVVSLLPDYPWDRPEPWHRAVNFDPENDKRSYIQAVVDMRRGLDLLFTRPDVDAKRVAYVGHSYGAQWGAILAAVDRRFKAAILIGGTPTLRDVLEGPGTAEFRKGLKPGQLEKYLEVNRPLDAINFIAQAAATPLFFQFATFEQNFSRGAVDRYYAAAREPKKVAWYDTGHDLNDPKAIADRGAWLVAQLGIATIRPFLEQELGVKPR